MEFERFMKKNKVQTEETKKFAPTKSIIDNITGKPVEWTFRKVRSDENDKIRDNATLEVPIDGKKNVYRPKLDTSKYLTDLVIASTVEPNLNNAELQDSYGVQDAKSLLYAMIDNPGELSKLELFVQEFSGLTSINEEIEKAKN